MIIKKKGQTIGILRVILENEKTTQTILHQAIVEECNKVGIKPITRSDISHICFGDTPDHRVSTYIKLLMGINVIRKRPEPYILDEIIEREEIFKTLKQRQNGL